MAMMKPRPERLKARAEKKMTKAQTLYGKADKIMKSGAPREIVSPTTKKYGGTNPPSAKDLALAKADDLYRRSARKESRAKALMEKSKEYDATNFKNKDIDILKRKFNQSYY